MIMVSRIRKYKPELKFIAGKCSPTTYKVLLENHCKDFTFALLDLIWGVLDGRVKLSNEQFNAVKKIEEPLQTICDRNLPFAKRKENLCNVNGRKTLRSLIRIIKDKL